MFVFRVQCICCVFYFCEFHVINVILCFEAVLYLFMKKKLCYFCEKINVRSNYELLFVGFIRINAFWKIRVRQNFPNQCFLESSKTCVRMLFGSMLSEKNMSFQRSYDVCVIKSAGGNFTRIKAFWEICEPCGNAVHVCLSSCFGNSMLISGMMNTRKKPTIFRNQCFSGEFRSCQRSCNY